ncbi:Holliday junction branch migration protein RuvA [Candidatus Parcubacteria bacterium 4484_255]|nr:MAG: Holliday junction branch migration protein RuvA [Candidatus Parcubacteria bacterium 4484_255]
MISSIQGTISNKDNESIQIIINGLGYKIFITKPLLDKVKIGQNIKLFTKLQIKNDSLKLYGLSTQSEMEYFKHLTSISGIGAKSALNVLSLISLEKLQNAILNKKAETLTKVSGIGKKTAERIILELKGIVEKNALLSGPDIKSDALAIDALLGMGYSIQQARKAVQQISSSQILKPEEKIKRALLILSGKQK